MRVSRRSWHYRMWNYWRCFFDETCKWPPIPFYKTEQRKDHRPKTLCTYFWQIVFFYTLTPPLLLAIGIAALAIAIVVAPFYGVSLGIRKLYRANRDWRSRRHREKWGSDRRPPKPPREPSVVTQYLKARKQKVCPMIELID